MKKSGSTTLLCFSPLVMISTFFIEIALLIWVIWRYKFDRVVQLSSLALFCLALFQFAEYMVCEGALGLDSLSWARIGYVAITLLPPLGIHIGLKIARRSNPWLLSAVYGSATLFICIFLFVGHGITASVCLGNYVIFEIAPWATSLYSLYYYGWLLVGMGLAYEYGRRAMNTYQKNALFGMLLGYTTFVLPTTVVNIVDPSTISGIPSIMCGFAVLFAVTLALYVIPQYVKSIDKKDLKHKH